MAADRRLRLSEALFNQLRNVGKAIRVRVRIREMLIVDRHRYVEQGSPVDVDGGGAEEEEAGGGARELRVTDALRCAYAIRHASVTMSRGRARTGGGGAHQQPAKFRHPSLIVLVASTTHSFSVRCSTT